MPILLFEDEHVARLHPLSLARPAFAISCGGERLVELLATLEQPIECRVRPHLRDCALRDFAKSEGGGRKSGPLLAVNARLVPSQSNLRQLQAILDAGRPGVVRSGDQIAAALITDAQQPAPGGNAAALLAYLSQAKLPRLDADLPLLEYPHDVVRHHLTNLSENLQRRIERGGLSEVRDGVFAAAGVTLPDQLATDTRQGPLVIESGVKLGPFAFLRGPVFLDHDAVVNEHASIKDGTHVGRGSRVGGEVAASIIEPHSNKQHHGFLGHSYLGSWVNLGAGTTNSNLKNTYGDVTMEYGGRKTPTGMQFVGCFVGDYTKSAINTAIFTGKTLGVCSMIYGVATTNVPSFVNYARSFGQVSELPVEVAIATQLRSFLRRKVIQRPSDAELIRDLYELTRAERQAWGPLAATPPAF